VYLDPGYRWRNQAEQFDADSQTWTSTGTKSTAAQALAVLLPNGQVLVAGGTKLLGSTQSSAVSVADAELYDPFTRSWTPTASLSTNRDGHTLTVLTDGQVLAAGGGPGGWGWYTPLLATELYDPTAGTWSITGSLNMNRTGHTATLLPDGRVLVVGGDCHLPSGVVGLATAELYTPSAEPFAEFSLELLEIEFSPVGCTNDSYQICGNLTLGASSDGVDLLAEEVTVEVGPVQTIIPAGSFANERPAYSWQGAVNGALVVARFEDQGSGDFKFCIEASALDLSGLSNPVEVRLKVGDDAGTETVRLAGRLSYGSADNTPEAVQGLISLVNDCELRKKRPLLASLEAALKSLQRGNGIAAANQLHAFRNKVRAQVADPVLARELVQGADQVIAALGGDKPKSLAAKLHGLKRGHGGKMQLKFSAPTGQVYFVEASSNLVDWEAIGVATQKPDGTFAVDDPDAATLLNRFYRVVSP